MTSISKNDYIDKLDNRVNKYNSTYHSTIKIKLFDVKSNKYINSSKEINDEDPEFKIGDIVRISKSKNNFCKTLCYNLVWRSFCDKKNKKYNSWTYLISDLKCEEIFRSFYKKELKKINQKAFVVEKVIKRKDDMFQIEKIR